MISSANRHSRVILAFMVTTIATGAASAAPQIVTQLYRACCLQDRSCTVSTAAWCTYAGGRLLSTGSCTPTVCHPIVASPLGACCRAGSVCEVMTLVNCSQVGGRVLGIGTTCAGAPCRPQIIPVPTGACCIPTGACMSRTAADCRSLGGTWQGERTVCGPTACGLALIEIKGQGAEDVFGLVLSGDGSTVAAAVSTPGVRPQVTVWRASQSWQPLRLPAEAVAPICLTSDGSRVIVNSVATRTPGMTTAVCSPGVPGLTPFGDYAAPRIAARTGHTVIGHDRDAAGRYRLVRWTWAPTAASWLTAQSAPSGDLMACTSTGDYLISRPLLGSGPGICGFSSVIGELRATNPTAPGTAGAMTLDGQRVFGVQRLGTSDELLTWNRSVTPTSTPLPSIRLVDAFRRDLGSEVVTVRCSGDGSVVIGNAAVVWNLPRYEAWVLSGSPRSLRSALTQQFPALNLSGWDLGSIIDMSVDGRTLLGAGVHQSTGRRQLWLIRLPESIR